MERVWLRQSLYRGLKQKRKIHPHRHDSADPGLTVSYTSISLQVIEGEQHANAVARSWHDGLKKVGLGKMGRE